ncbi:hypothetical protein Pdw03_3596 [Penicillium digitatum]|uniref:Uncharacterized protein n=1 Tax=Penicillium digitatum TaxID=36651 RepID=A0A7T6XGM6_PENDI|nr:hypothetical protein Pdw03_3596 [Penicillium digitatum]
MSLLLDPCMKLLKGSARQAVFLSNCSGSRRQLRVGQGRVSVDQLNRERSTIKSALAPLFDSVAGTCCCMVAPLPVPGTWSPTIAQADRVLLDGGDIPVGLPHN